MILLGSQRDLDKEEPTGEDLYEIGTVAVIMRMLKLPDGRIRILVQGLARATIESVEVGGEYLRAHLQVIQETNAPERSLEVEALIRNVRASMEKAANLGKNISPEVMAIIANLDDAGRLSDLSASNLELKVEDAQSVLEIADTTARLRRVNELLNKEIEVLTVQQEINTQARAVRKLKEKPKGPILCLVGPPGVGKTSLGRSIARALGRKFMRLSLGGVHDEAEIRGHRRTYVGAMPGRIVQSIQQAGTNNPLIMLDEIDKVGADFRGDPSSALLEVLDPEQNNSFRDNYLNVTFDLSNAIFMTTANVLDTIQSALRDRMEVIRIAGYTEEEKLEIAQRHLLPKQMDETGITARDVNISRTAMAAIIQRYTHEAGLRQLEREIGSICRKVARRIGEGRREPVRVSLRNLHEFLGAPKITPDEVLKKDQIGVATGLAWTAVGGDVLFIEALRIKGKGNLVLTGQIGEIMRESAQAAYSYAKSRARELDIEPDDVNNFDIHIHIPEGAIPKDGPSAGITLATALVSVLSRRPVRKDVAMTGEITLRGNVLPVGGVKEKVLAARRARVRKIIIPLQNRRDLDEVPKEPLKDIQFIFVDNVRQVFREALGEKEKPAVAPSPRPVRLPQAASPRRDL